jgi:hypothetical protein
MSNDFKFSWQFTGDADPVLGACSVEMDCIATVSEKHVSFFLWVKNKQCKI